ncbi:MAG: glucose-phosphate cytidylyltransferase [Firmicutes bacterium]|nr:glucose-phosphate cytidylyltransferase [Bacillota bacterium]
MKVVILAGGFGTRISEESHLKPKPMIEIGDQPILWHIMKIYSHYGFNDFIICLGYKGYYIKQYFAQYFLQKSTITFDFRMANQQIIHDYHVEPWKVTLVDTGRDTMTGGRIKRIQPYVGNESFMLTYGDGVSNIDLDRLVAFHKNHGKLATITAVNPPGRFGVLNIDDDKKITNFIEKGKVEGSWINAGFMVLQPEIFEYIEGGDATIFESAPLEALARNEQLMAYRHCGFWQCMDTMRDKSLLENLWAGDAAPWKVW